MHLVVDEEVPASLKGPDGLLQQEGLELVQVRESYFMIL